MLVKTAYFVSSHTTVHKCPAPDKPEYAFIGRSNVGKSSLINMLTNHKKLAKVSSTPGKTQLINYFLINDDWYLVDLPGYGYAKISKTQRAKWERFIRDYLLKRSNLQCVFLLIDSRIPPQEKDLEFARWLGEMQIPFVLTFTKIDKNTKSVLKQNLETFSKRFLEEWESMPQHFLSSSENTSGKEEILAFIDEVNERF